MSANPSTVTLSLIAHTNVGKTTLARTLLRRDIGEVLDRAHVTDVSESHALIETAAGATLRLWDTPGFGDTARLLRRLEQSGNPLGWLLSQIWDRFVDRPLWCSQQAIRNVKEEADVVLYLVNAAEHPGQSGYVDMEMKILSWIAVPVIVLLNQTGPPREAALERAEERNWQKHLEKFPLVTQTLSLDAFARCWVQEGILLDAVAGLLPATKQETCRSLAAAWRRQNLDIFQRAIKALARQLAEACCDQETLEKPSLTDAFLRMLSTWGGANPKSFAGKETAMALLAERADHRIRATMDDLIKLHGLEGRAAGEILQRLRDDYATRTPISEGISALLGGFVSGALVGLGADLAAGGLTFGGGALVGGILGAAGAGGLAKGYNLIRGENTPTIRWSTDFFSGLVRSALLRYLAIAHYGRGRGNYAESEHPKFWQHEVAACLQAHRSEVETIWELGKTASNRDTVAGRLELLLGQCAARC